MQSSLIEVIEEQEKIIEMQSERIRKLSELLANYKSIRGIAKKVAMWMLVVVGAIVDQLIAYTTEQFGWIFPASFLVACLVSVWIICNELISILENIKDIGVVIPR